MLTVFGFVICHLDFLSLKPMLSFGTDQLQIAINNEELSKYVCWYFWTLYVVCYTLLFCNIIVQTWYVLFKSVITYTYIYFIFIKCLLYIIIWSVCFII